MIEIKLVDYTVDELNEHITEFVRLSKELEFISDFDAIRFDRLKYNVLLANDEDEISISKAIVCMVIIARELEKIINCERKRSNDKS